MPRDFKAWFETYNEKEAILLTNDFRTALTLTKSHEKLHRTFEGFLKKGLLSSQESRLFYDACGRLGEFLDGQRNPLVSLKSTLKGWEPSKVFYQDLAGELIKKKRLRIPNQDFRLLMGTGFSYLETVSFVRQMNDAKLDLLPDSVGPLLDAIDPKAFHRLVRSYLDEVNQEFVIGGSPRSFDKLGSILEVLGGGLVLVADLVTTGIGLGPAAISVGGGMIAIGDGLRRV